MARLVGYQALEARLRALGAGGGPGMMKMLGATAVGHAKRYAAPHRKTSHLEHSIIYVDPTATHVRVVATVPYAAYVEFGTRPHTITPRAKQALAWGGARRLTGTLRSGASATHFAMRVNHPGTKAYPFLMPGARAAVEGGGLRDAIVTAWNKAA